MAIFRRRESSQSARAGGRKGRDSAQLPWVLEALASHEFDVWCEAQQTLVGMTDPETTAALVSRLSHESSDVRKRVVELLAGRDRDAVMPHLVEKLQDPAFNVRSSAIEVLQQYGWEPSSPFERIVSWLSVDLNVVRYDSSHAESFHSMVDALGDDAVEPLENAFTSHLSARRRMALEALIRLGSERVVPILGQLVDSSSLDYSGQQRAAVGLVQMRDRTLPVAASPQGHLMMREPGEPLTQITSVDELRIGDIVRLWHDILRDWATDWLEVRGIVGRFVVFRVPRTGAYDARGRGDIEDWRPPPLWRAPGELFI